MKIGVLYGGLSSERPVSLNSAKGVINALKRKGYETVEIDFQHVKQLDSFINEKIDIVFNALHGGIGEDGHIQAYLDLLNIPYIGSDCVSSALAMDKWKAKRIFKEVGIPVAKDWKIIKETWKDKKSTYKEVWREDRMYVIKPIHEGSTIGMTFATGVVEIEKGIDTAFQYDTEVLVEEFIKGREFTVGVMGEKGNEIALPIVEIVPKTKFYDYEAKYTKGMTEYLVPASLPEKIEKRMKEIGVTAHQSLGCRTYARVDVILSEDNIPYVLEINTLPGMTETSLFPKAAKSFGLEYDDMIEHLILTGLKNQQLILKRETDENEQMKKELKEKLIEKANEIKKMLN